MSFGSERSGRESTGDRGETTDAVVIGAGINGCGIARELAVRGRRVLVLDKGTVGGGTSSKSSCLVHGGLRYLETFQLGLVYEALHDRQELLETYPDLVRLCPFYLPVYEGCPRPTWLIWTGIKLYDLLAGSRSPVRSGRVAKGAFRQRFPAIKPEGLKRVLRYYDGKTDDWALTRRVAEGVRELGGEVLEHTEVSGFEWDDEGITLATERGGFKSRIAVNATGPWIDEVVDRLGMPARHRVRKVSGVHLFLDGLLVPEPMLLQARGKRVLFVIPEPEKERTMIGTTEREEDAPVDAVGVHEDDVTYLLDEVNAYLSDEARVRREDVRRASVGVRALVARRGDPTDLSREYELDLHRKGKAQLLHVFGGKLTTFPSLARRAVKALGV